MEPFKNELSAGKARLIGAALQRAYPQFPLARFRKGLSAALEPLELKQRALLLAERVASCLPEDPGAAFPILSRALDPDPSGRPGLADERGCFLWPPTEVFGRHVNRDFPLAAIP